MPSIHLRGVCHAYSSASVTFSDVDLDLAADGSGATWVGVVGPNGAGKSTLLRLVAGEDSPTAGDIEVHAHLPPVYVPQEVAEPTLQVRSFSSDWDGPAAELRSRLALDPDDLDPITGRGWDTLSPGERRRWEVAAAVAAGTEILLLDEPTNHLDGTSRDLLLDSVTADGPDGFRGLGLVVSHDRAFLDRLTTRTLRVERGTTTLHAGCYSEASARWRADEDAARDRHDRASRELRRQRRILGDVRRDRHGAEAGPRRDRRLGGARDPDAREAGRKFAARKAEAKLANRVGQAHARVGRAEATVAAAGETIAREHAGAIAFRHSTSGRRVLAEVVGDIRHAGGEPWLLGVDVALHRGAHVHLAGANGAGKTTLLRALLVALAASAETVAVLPQRLDDPAAEVRTVRTLDTAARGRVLGALATLGVHPERILATDDPSPGEARKVVLARMLAADGAGVLVLDEPANHLDLPSIEHLEQALAAWPGALVLVTHDRQLAERTTTSRWEVIDRRVDVDRL